MTYEVLALKYRPKVFEDLVGQEAVTRTLINAIQQGRIANAFVFSGVRGVGKTTTARILAKALNCSSGPIVRPCGECASCKEIPISRSLDVFEIDGASQRKVDETQELLASLQYAPSRDRFKILIVDEVHMFSAHSFNALLKTLEEPPPHVKFIFATTESHKIPDTILSRCQEFEFRTVSAPEIAQQLKKIATAENITISEAALSTLARVAEGSLRDGISAFDQVIAAVGTEIEESRVTEILGLPDRDVLRDTARAIVQRDTATILKTVDELVKSGRDLRFFVAAMIQFFRDVLVKRVAPNVPELFELSEESALLEEIGKELSEEDLLRSLDVLTETEMALRTTSEPRFHLEMTLLKLSQLRRLASFEELLARFEALLGGGSPSSSSSSDPGAGASKKEVAVRRAAKPLETETKSESEKRRPNEALARPPEGVEAQREAGRGTGDAGVGLGVGAVAVAGAGAGAGAKAPTSTASEATGTVPKLEQFVERLRTSKPMLHALVTRHDRAKIAGGELKLHFSSRERVIVEQLQQKELKAMLDEQARALFGRPFEVTIEIHENGLGPGEGGGDDEGGPESDRSGAGDASESATVAERSGTDIAAEDGEPSTTNEPEPESGSEDLRARAQKDPMVRRFLETFQAEVEDVRRREPK